MAITIDWGTKIISVPKADMTLIQSSPTEIRQLNLDTFRLILKDLEDSEEGMAYLRTHNHNTSVTVGGVTLARVIEIINGYTVTFEDGQYAVNLVGANSNVGDVVNVNQVSVRSANSAGLQDLSTILSAAYNGEVCINTSTGQSGTDVPIGTRTAPVNNFADALTIAAKEGANTLRLLNSVTLSNTTFPPGLTFTSDNAGLITLTIADSATVSGCQFSNLTIAGNVDGDNILRECLLTNISFASGFIFQCSLDGQIDVKPGALLNLLDCFSNQLAGQSDPIIDMGGNGKLIVRNYNGALDIRNHNDDSGDGDTCLDINSGVIKLDSTITAGLWPIRGIARVVNNATGTADVRDQTINNLVNTNADALGIVNEGVKKASILIPHNTDI
jgi:hypothetical protein